MVRLRFASPTPGPSVYPQPQPSGIPADPFSRRPYNFAVGRNGMMERIQVGGLSVAKVFHDCIEREALPGTGVASDAFWGGLAGLVRDLGPRNRELLDVRDQLQARIDEYHRTNAGKPFDAAGHERFLRDIGYLRPEPEDFTIRTQNVDDEIARI